VISCKTLRRVIPGVVAACLLTSCTNRTILHGWNEHAGKPGASGKYIAVWFVKNSGQQMKLFAVKRKAALGEDRLKQAVQELLRGPTSAEEHAGVGTEIPRGTILLAVAPKGREVELNVSRRFALDGGTSSFEMRLSQLRKTVVQAAPGTDVYLDIEGKRLRVEEGEGIEVSQPINRIASQSEEL
jgi:spore germination protein GerM